MSLLHRTEKAFAGSISQIPEMRMDRKIPTTTDPIAFDGVKQDTANLEEYQQE